MRVPLMMGLITVPTPKMTGFVGMISLVMYIHQSVNNLQNLNHSLQSDFLFTLNYLHFLCLKILYLRAIMSKSFENCEKGKQIVSYVDFFQCSVL